MHSQGPKAAAPFLTSCWGSVLRTEHREPIRLWPSSGLDVYCVSAGCAKKTIQRMYLDRRSADVGDRIEESTMSSIGLAHTCQELKKAALCSMNHRNWREISGTSYMRRSLRPLSLTKGLIGRNPRVGSPCNDPLAAV